MAKPATAKLIPLPDWAAQEFDPPPSAWVLRRLCRDGLIYPAPIKLGKTWRVAGNARLLTDNRPVGGGLVAQLQDWRK